MSKKLFVGSLSWDTNDEGLKNAFSAHGEVSEAVVISDRDTGRSRGFGFVTFEDDEAADKAIAALNGTELDGRTILPSPFFTLRLGRSLALPNVRMLFDIAASRRAGPAPISSWPSSAATLMWWPGRIAF